MKRSKTLDLESELLIAMVQSSDESPASSPSTASDISSPAADSQSAGLSYLADSDTASEDIPSETSDDRAFIASETEESSFFSSASSEVSISDICPWCSTRSNVVDAVGDPRHNYGTRLTISSHATQ